MGKKVLVADKHKCPRTTVSRYVIGAVSGAQVTAVVDAGALVDQARNGAYDLVLTGIAGKDGGLEAVRQIRRTGNQVPIYLLGASDTKQQAADAGATGYVPKDDLFRSLSVLDPVIDKYLR